MTTVTGIARGVSEAAVLVALAGACSSFGETADPVVDAGAPAPDAGAPPPSDAAADARRPCEGRTDLLLCESFDSEDFLARGWTEEVSAGTIGTGSTPLGPTGPSPSSVGEICPKRTRAT